MTNKHLQMLSKAPAVAQISNYQIKLEFTTSAIDRLLLVPRQSPWKAVGSGGDGSTDTDTDTDIDTDIDT